MRSESLLRALAIGMLLTATTVLAAACGGSGGESSDSGTTAKESPPTKADWIDRADAICEKALADEGLASGAERLSTPSLKKSAALLHREATELEGIPAPVQQRQQIAKLIRAVGSVADLMSEQYEGAPPSTGGGQPSEYEFDEILTTLGTPIVTMVKAFQAYGARTCGEQTFGFPVS